MSNKVTDNSFLESKIYIRELALSNLSNNKKNVLDLYCGKKGLMYLHVWKNCNNYLGIDKTPHTFAQTLTMDNRRAIKEITLSDFNIFDLDSYSSPWQLMEYILKNKQNDNQYVIIFTSGENRGLYKITNKFIRKATNTHNLTYTGFLRFYHKMVIEQCIREIQERTESDIKIIKYIINKKPNLSEPVYGYLAIN